MRERAPSLLGEELSLELSEEVEDELEEESEELESPNQARRRAMLRPWPEAELPELLLGEDEESELLPSLLATELLLLLLLRLPFLLRGSPSACLLSRLRRLRAASTNSSKPR